MLNDKLWKVISSHLPKTIFVKGVTEADAQSNLGNALAGPETLALVLSDARIEAATFEDLPKAFFVDDHI